MRLPKPFLLLGIVLLLVSACQTNGGGSPERLSQTRSERPTPESTGSSNSRSSTEVLNLREDLRLVRQQQAELQNQVEEVMREHRAMRKKVEDLEKSLQESMDQQYATVSQLNRTRDELRRTLEEDIRRSRREMVREASEKIDDLAKQTQNALDSLARSIASRPTSGGGSGASRTQFSDDYPQEGVTHVVARGETLSGIAQRYGSSVRDIQNANRIARPETIQVGQTLFIPLSD